MLLQDGYNWLKFFWWTTSFEARQLAVALVHSYNQDNFLAWLILGRSSLEYAAVSYYFLKKLAHFELQGPTIAMSKLMAMEDLLLQYAPGHDSTGPICSWATASVGFQRQAVFKTIDQGQGRVTGVLYPGRPADARPAVFAWRSVI